MAIVGFPKRFGQVAGPGACIRSGDPIVSQLAFLCIPSVAGAQDLVSGALGTLNVTSNFKGVTQIGSGVNASTSTGALSFPPTAPVGQLNLAATIVVWVNPTVAGGFFAAKFGTSGEGLVLRGPTTGFLQSPTNFTDAFHNSSISYTWTANTLHCFALTFKSGAYTYYDNGIQVGADNVGDANPLAIATNFTGVAIAADPGNSAASGVYPFGALWTRALSAAEIQRLYVDPYCVISPAKSFRAFSTIVAGTSTGGLLTLGCGA